jgi:hypothetical protein
MDKARLDGSSGKTRDVLVEMLVVGRVEVERRRSQREKGGRCEKVAVRCGAVRCSTWDGQCSNKGRHGKGQNEKKDTNEKRN